MSTPEGMEGVRQAILAAWPTSAQWPSHVWHRWAEELHGFTDEELIRAVRHIARQGRDYPPGWGMIYRAASGPRTARLAAERERRWREGSE